MNIELELAKFLGFIALGYWSFCYFGSFWIAIPFAMMGSGIVAITYKLSQKENT